MDSGFVKIGLAQLSQPVKRRMLYINTDRRTGGHTDLLNIDTLYGPRYEEAFLPIGKNGHGRFAPLALPHMQDTSNNFTGWAIILPNYNCSVVHVPGKQVFCMTCCLVLLAKSTGTTSDPRRD